MGKLRTMTKKEVDDQRKKAQEEEAAKAFEEYVATFQETPGKSDKVWVKAGTYDAGRRQEDTREKGKLYKPQSRLSELADKLSTAERAEEYAWMMGEKKPEKPGKRRGREEKKSNLEIFKEELRQIQIEREERHKYKGAVKSIDGGSGLGNLGVSALQRSSAVDDSKYGSFDNGDPTTTNLYLGNLNPKITEQQLKEVFGKYGPLASIKIMWPRSDEEKARGKNCGFVAYMNRKDGERALKFLSGKDVMHYEMKLGWGKAVPIPPHPIYIPPIMLELTMPPPPSGLPFNAQPNKKHRSLIKPYPMEPYSMDGDSGVDLDRILPEAIVKVVIPTERNLLMLIHRMVEFVIRDGPMFEAMIMNREINNPMFRFLFENKSPAHIYYRWKLFSMLQGDTQTKWRTLEFRMYKTGSIWKPPPMNPYTQGMPDDLVQEEEKEPRKGSLSATQRERIEDILRNITPERLKVAEAMIFCIEHSEAADEICDLMSEALANVHTQIQKKVARLYVISDILHNCGANITNASYYRKGLEARLPDIFRNVYAAYTALDSRLKAEGFKNRVMRVFRAWEEWAVYPKNFLIKLQNTFLGLTAVPTCLVPERESEEEEDVDGAPLSDPDEDIDGVPLDGAALLKGASKHAEEDIDGIPMTEDRGGPDMFAPRGGDDGGLPKGLPSGFVPSKWETVDPEQVEAQAMTTSKWDTLDQEEGGGSSAGGTDSQDADYLLASRDMDESRRARLREIELKAMQYQDELEGGQRTLKSGWNIQQQVEHYRRKMLRKAEKGDREKEEREKEEKKESKEKETEKRGGKKKRSVSPPPKSKPPRKSRSQSRSVSPTPSAKRSRRSPRSRSPGRKRSPHPAKRSRRSRDASPPTPPRIKSSRAGTTPSPPRIKHSSREVSPPTPPRIKHSRALATPSPPRIKHRGRSPSSGKRRAAVSPSPPRVKRRSNTPSPPPRKHKHKHKY